MLLALLLAAAASDENLQFDFELGSGSAWARSICDSYGCPNAFTGSVRVGFGSAFASLGARAAGIFGGGDRPCSGACGGQQSRSLLADMRFNTLGTTQATFGFALGVGNLMRLECNCDQHYGVQASGMTIIEGTLGVRTFALSPADRLFHVGIDLRVASWSGGASSPGNRSSDLRSPPDPVMAIPVLSLLATIGASL